MRKIFRTRLPILSAPAVHGAAPTPPVLLDQFTGTGALTAHTPDICPAGSSWAIINGTFANLSGGYLPYTTGANGKALINCGLDEFEIRWKSKHFTSAGSYASGVMFRSNNLGNSFYAIGTQCISTVSSIYFNVPGQIILWPGQTNGNTWTQTLVNNTYYEWRAWIKGGICRVYNATGALVLAAASAVKTGQYFVGPFCEQPFGNWDFIEVKPVTRRLINFSVMGDSISNDPGEWPNNFAAKHNNGYCYPTNHAVAGSTVWSQMDTQTDQCELDTTADFTIVALGTNDNEANNIQAKYQANLEELYGTRGKPIYCMGILNKTDETYRATNNTRIAAAVAAAVANGVNATYWNTDGWIDPATDTSDGLHPNAAGQIKIANQVVDLI